jgi:hypothetical protein
MSAANRNGLARNSNLFNRLRSLCSKQGRSKAGKKRHRVGRNLQLEGLEGREMFSVSSLWFSGSTLVVKTDDVATNVSVNQSGSNIRINDVSTGRSWDYQASTVGSVEFQGGAGNDRFVNYVYSLPVRAYGFGGNDYLEGYNGADDLVGGDGNDTLVGYGGNDRMWGQAGNDIIRGMAGNDQLMGAAGYDHLDGGSGDDQAWGGDHADILLGGDGNDQLIGGNGDDRLNGQAGIDQLWAEAGNDVLISIDAAFGEYVDSGTGADIMWIDRVGFATDNAIAASSSDIVQHVASFANGADRTLNGDNIADPTDTGAKLRYHNNITSDNTQGSNPLFSSSGPSMTDIEQGGVGDCWLMAGLSAIGLDSPHSIRQNVVDFDDGTFGVRLGNNFYRVDNELPVHNTGAGATDNNLRFAGLGAQNSMWVAAVEKAFAHYRTGANTYDSLNGGWAVEVNRAFRSSSAGEKSIRSYSSATALANDMYNRYWAYQAVTIGFVGSLSGNPPLIGNHMYTVAGFNRNSAGEIVSIRLRNPWGVDGTGNDGSNDGFVTVTPAQLYAQTGRVNWGAV